MKSLALVLALLPASVRADTAEFALTIKDHRFDPTVVRIPAEMKVKLVITNLDTTPEEFESHDLNREKVIVPGGKVTIFIGPLKPGRYPFFGEFHQDTAQGAAIVE